MSTHSESITARCDTMRCSITDQSSAPSSAQLPQLYLSLPSVHHFARSLFFPLLHMCPHSSPQSHTPAKMPKWKPFVLNSCPDQTSGKSGRPKRDRRQESSFPETTARQEASEQLTALEGSKELSSLVKLSSSLRSFLLSTVVFLHVLVRAFLKNSTCWSRVLYPA